MSKDSYQVSLRMMMLVSGLMTAATTQAALVGEWTFDSQSFVNSGTAGSVHDGTFVTANTGYFSTDTVEIPEDPAAFYRVIAE